MSVLGFLNYRSTSVPFFDSKMSLQHWEFIKQHLGGYGFETSNNMGIAVKRVERIGHWYQWTGNRVTHPTVW
jgi:hypothetical protein